MIQEIRAYKVDPPADVHKVCKGVLVLLGHGKWAGAEHELKDWDDCRPKITRAMIKDMQVRYIYVCILRRGLVRPIPSTRPRAVHDLEYPPTRACTGLRGDRRQRTRHAE